jgi:hypothetical protein
MPVLLYSIPVPSPCVTSCVLKLGVQEGSDELSLSLDCIMGIMVSWFCDAVKVFLQGNVAGLESGNQTGLQSSQALYQVMIFVEGQCRIDS